MSSAPLHVGIVKIKFFLLSKVFNGAATQDDVYEFARPLALSVTRGYNATIFAYGHTGSGKTYTMMGDSRNPGIVSFGYFAFLCPSYRLTSYGPSLFVVVDDRFLEQSMTFFCN